MSVWEDKNGEPCCVTTGGLSGSLPLSVLMEDLMGEPVQRIGRQGHGGIITMAHRTAERDGEDFAELLVVPPPRETVVQVAD